MQVTFVTVPVVDLPTASFNSQGGHASENEQYYKAHAYSDPALGI